jgi:hypothetical protein
MTEYIAEDQAQAGLTPVILVTGEMEIGGSQGWLQAKP